MMVTTTVSISGNLSGLLERMVRKNFEAQGIGEGASPLLVSGEILEATTDAEGPDHVFVAVTAALSVREKATNKPILNRTLSARHVTAVTQLTNEAWESAFVGAMNQINGQIQSIAAYTSRAMVEASREGAQEARSASGSCSVVHPDGLILTAYHVLEGARQISVQLADGRRFLAAIRQSDPANDLALLKIQASHLPFISLAPIRSPKIGEYVFTIGFPARSVLGSDAKFTEGSISSLTGPQGMASLMQISVPIQPGNSGGPLISATGDLVGIITSTASVKTFVRITGTLPQNVNWAVKADYARLLFDPPVSSGASAQSREQAIEIGKAAACLVETNM